MRREHHQAKRVTLAALGVVIVLLLVQLSGLGSVDQRLDGTSIFLLLLAGLLALALVSPKTVVEIVERIEGVKLPGGFEVALARVERLQPTIAGLSEDVGIADKAYDRDDVTVKSRPVGGGSVEEYRAVRAKLEERLRFIRDALLQLGDEMGYETIVFEIYDRGLLDPDEVQVVLDLLRRDEAEIADLPPELLAPYLNGGWRFSVRLGTLVFERDVRGRLTKAGWFLLDFEQARHHRPDFLAFHNERWFLVATRVAPKKSEIVRRRLAKMQVPFDARPMLVVPDSREWQPDKVGPRVIVMTLSSALAEL